MMKAFTPVALLIALAGAVSAADEIPVVTLPPESLVQSHLRDYVELRRRSLLSIISRKSRATGKQKQSARQSLDNFAPDLMPIRPPYEVGEMGKTNGVFEVVNILEDNKGVLVTTWWETYRPTTTHHQTVLLIGFPHRNLIDGKEIKLEGDVWVSRTFRYKTVIGGTNTISVIQPVNINPFITEKFLKELGLKPQKAAGAP